MKYVNAKDVLPEDLLVSIKKYFQGGYLYVPKEDCCGIKEKTAYKIELEKRNQQIYLQHLEGKTNGHLGRIYHLSESSIRRIILKEKREYQEMEKMIAHILPLWGIEAKQLSQIYPTTWEVNRAYVLKIYEDKTQLEQNIKISEILLKCDIPVVKILLTERKEKYAEMENFYFLMTRKLPGSNLSDRKDTAMAYKMGCAIARLHSAFKECEKKIDFWDNSLLSEMKGWIQEALIANEWQIINKAEYKETVDYLEEIYNFLPIQLIHRDVHFGNFLFCKEDLSGYIDFDLSQRNIRIFDLCYFLTGLLAEETDDSFTKSEWLEIVKTVISGYESRIPLCAEEKNAMPCVMESIEILFTAYFATLDNIKLAKDAGKVFRFLKNNEKEIKNTIESLKYR